MTTDRPLRHIPHDDIWCDIMSHHPTQPGSDFKFDTIPAPAPLFDLANPRFDLDDEPPSMRLS